MNKLFKSLLFIIAILLVIHQVGCCGAFEAEKPEIVKLQPEPDKTDKPYADTILRLGRIPFSNATEMVRKHDKFLKYLTDSVGVKETRLRTAAEYSGIVSLLERGEIDIAWLSTMSSAEVRDNPNVRFIAKPVRFGTTFYRGLILTRTDTGIRSLQDLRGKRIAWVEPDSASSYIFPKALFIEAGINPSTDFSETVFLGTHDAVVLNVLLDRYDAGACYDDARESLTDKTKVDELRVLATTPDISNEAIVVRANLPNDLIESIKAAFLALDNKVVEHQEVLEHLTNVEGFVQTNPNDYDYIDKVRKLLLEHQD